MTTAGASLGRRGALVLLAGTALTACAPRRSASTPLIDLFAAASLREVLDAAAAEHQQQTGRIVRATYAGSAKLARQIAQGARLPGFRDITLGGNAVNDALPGYDLVTGLGTPRIANLAEDLLALQKSWIGIR